MTASGGPGEVLLRPAVEADLPAVAELLLAARAAAVPAMPPVPPGAVDVVRRDVATWDLEQRETWLAEPASADGPTGPLAFVTLADDWLESLYVAPAAQRAGVGSLLLDLARALRPGGFCLWVLAANAPARAFYAAHGLVELETTDGSRNPEGVPDVRVAWPGADPLAYYRRLIDDADDDLGEVLSRRAALTRAVQAAKGHDAPRDPGREAAVVARVARGAPALGADRVAEVVEVVIRTGLEAARPDHG